MSKHALSSVKWLWYTFLITLAKDFLSTSPLQSSKSNWRLTNWIVMWPFCPRNLSTRQSTSIVSRCQCYIERFWLEYGTCLDSFLGYNLYKWRSFKLRMTHNIWNDCFENCRKLTSLRMLYYASLYIALTDWHWLNYNYSVKSFNIGHWG